MRDASNTQTTRQLVFKHYGSFTRALLTMFEVTLGNWMPPCRALVDHVDESYWIFFVTYRVVIGFSVVNVISAVFMRETFQVAAMDDELMVIQVQRQNEKSLRKMKALFIAADTTGDGLITLPEFKSIMTDPWVAAWMRGLEISVADVEKVFELISGDGGLLSLDDLVRGIQRLKGTARSLDMASILHEQREIVRLLTAIRQSLPPIQDRRISQV